MKPLARSKNASTNISCTLCFASLIFFGAGLVGCDEQGDNYLKGSLVETYKIDFDTTRVRLYTNELAIDYVSDAANGELISLRVTVNVADTTNQTDMAYDLVKQGSVQRGQGFGSDLPEMLSGTLTLSAYSPENGSDISGEFQAVFIGTNGAQLSLRGGFAAPLEVVP